MQKPSIQKNACRKHFMKIQNFTKLSVCRIPEMCLYIRPQKILFLWTTYRRLVEALLSKKANRRSSVYFYLKEISTEGLRRTSRWHAVQKIFWLWMEHKRTYVYRKKCQRSSYRKCLRNIFCPQLYVTTSYALCRFLQKISRIYTFL